MSDQCQVEDEILILCQTEKSLSNHEATSVSEQMFQDAAGGLHSLHEDDLSR